MKDIDLFLCCKPEVYPILKIPVVSLDHILNKHSLYLLRSYGISDDSEDLKQGKLMFRDRFYLTYTDIMSFSHAILKQRTS